MKKHRLITSAAMLTMAAALTLSGRGGSTTDAGSLGCGFKAASGGFRKVQGDKSGRGIRL